jgi:hypothetical protein
VDLDAIIFNPISSTVLKWFSLKLLVGGMIFSVVQTIVWHCLIVGLLFVLFDCWANLVTSHAVFS